MEGIGAVTVFQQSVKKHKLICENYIGDGDTSFKEVEAENPYKDYDLILSKLECTGHVQKRMGTRDLRRSCNNSSTKLSVKGKHTDKVVNTLHNYYVKLLYKSLWHCYHSPKEKGGIVNIRGNLR